MRVRPVVVILAAMLAAAPIALAEDSPLSAGCEDAVAREVWELAIDLCSPELLPADAPIETQARVLAGRAKAYAATGDTERAAADSAEAERLSATSGADLYAYRARGFFEKGDLRNALSSIDRAIRLSTEPRAEYHRLRAEVLWDSDENDRALADANRAIELDPRNAQAYALRASIYLARRDEARAKPDIAQATALSKNCELRLRIRANVTGTTQSGTRSYALSCPESGAAP